MSLSNLTNYTATEWNNLDITPFKKPPKVTKEGNPDPDVSIDPVGWVGEDGFAFRISTEANNDSHVSIFNATADEMGVNVTRGEAPEAFITYWTVETGPGNGKDDDWHVAYEVEKDKKKTGKWIFTKSKDDDQQDRPGCLGMLAGLLP